MGEPRFHIVYCLAALDLGGSELATLELAEGLAARGHRVTLIAAPGPLAPRAAAAGIEILPWAIGRKRARTLLWVPRLRAWLAHRRPDILHLQARLPGWLAYLAWRTLPAGRRPHLVSTVHGHYSIGVYSRVMTRGERVIAVSASIEDYLGRLDPGCRGRVAVIPGGIDPRHYRHGWRPEAEWLAAFRATLGVQPTTRLVTLVARGTRLKNHAAFIRLIAALRRLGCDVHGLLVGGFAPRRRHYLTELQRQAAELGVASALHFIGERTDTREIIATSNLVVNLSSKPEAFGRTLLEALALGVPAAGWANGGSGEILGRMYPAGLVPFGDDAALADTARRLLTAPPQVPDTQPYPLEWTIERTLDLYRSLDPDLS